MRAYLLTHLSDAVLLRDLRALIARERAATAAVLAHIAEVDARQLYLPAAYPSMYLYCVNELGLSEDAALKRIQAARAARRFPAIFAALADGRLHLSAVCLLGPHLTPENAGELVAAAAQRTKAEVELLLARRFPRSERLPLVRALPASAPPSGGHSVAGLSADSPVAPSAGVGEWAGEPAPGQVETPSPPSRLEPLAPRRYELCVTIGQETHDKLCHARGLLSHRIPGGDLAAVLDGVLDLAIGQLEKQKLGATETPRPGRRTTHPRHIPAAVRRAVWERDGGRCTYVSATGRRCPARHRLEFDHLEPVARGGRATVEGVRLLCRSHNQAEAERVLGADFMSEKRAAARHAAGQARARAVAGEQAARSPVIAREPDQDVLAGLRELGFRADEARRAALYGASLEGATPEQRMRAALKFLCPRPRSTRPGRDPPRASI